VKIGSGPAAVIPALNIRATLSASEATFPYERDGKAAERAGKPEDLPYLNTVSKLT